MSAGARSAKESAMRLLERRDYGRDELLARLVEKGFGEEEAAAAADRCVELGFINDENYAAMVARHYSARGFGERRIREELRRRRIPREHWDTALDAVPGDSDSAYRCLCSKMRGRAPEPDELRRAAAAVQRRGFGYQETREAVERYRGEYATQEEA